MLVFVVPILGLVISAGASIGGPAAFWRQWLRWCEATGGCRCTVVQFSTADVYSDESG